MIRWWWRGEEMEMKSNRNKTVIIIIVIISARGANGYNSIPVHRSETRMTGQRPSICHKFKAKSSTISYSVLWWVASRSWARERGRDRSNEPLHFIASVYRVHSNDQPKIFQVIKSIIFPGLIRNRSEQSLSFVLFIDRHQPLPLLLILCLSAIQVHNPNPILLLNHRWQAQSLIIIAS